MKALIGLLGVPLAAAVGVACSAGPEPLGPEPAGSTSSALKTPVMPLPCVVGGPCILHDEPPIVNPTVIPFPDLKPEGPAALLPTLTPGHPYTPFLTANGAAGGALGHELGIGADAAAGWFVFNEDLAPMEATGGGALNLLPAMGLPVVSSSGGVRVDTGNANSEACVFVSQLLDPAGAGKGGAINDHQPAVAYVDKTWQITNADYAPIAPSAAFVVLTPGAIANTRAALLVTTENSVVKGGTVYIDDPRTNGHPEDVLFVTQNLTPAVPDSYEYGKGPTGPLGVAYDSSVQAWTVVTEDGSPMPARAAFNVLVTVTIL